MDKLNVMFDASQFAVAFAPATNDSSSAPSQSAAVVWLEGSTGVAEAGFSSGHGELNYHGHSHVFSVSSLSIEDAEAAAIYATGRVLRLGKVSDFGGIYRVFGAGGRNAGGALTSNLLNEHGVVIQLVATDSATAANHAVRSVRVRLAPGAGGGSVR
jgi:hypothetical protein